MMLSGTVIAQVLSVIALPYFQKYLYNPDDFALFTWFFELTAIFIGVSALRLETGIVLERDQSMAIKLALLCLRLVFFSSVIYTVLVLGLSYFVANFELFRNELWLLLLFPVTIFFTGGTQVFVAYYTRQKLFKQQAANKIVQSSSALVPQFALGQFGYNQLGLIAGKIFGVVIGFAGLWSRIAKDFKQIPFPTKKERKELRSKHKDFIRYTTPGTFLGMFINFVFIDLFLYYFGDDLTGQLGASKHYIGMGFSVLSVSFAQVFYGRIARIEDKVELRNLYTYWLIRLSAIALMVIITVWIFPNVWVVNILGEKWSQLLPVMRVLSLWMGVMFVTSSLSFIYIKLNRQRTTVIIDALHLLFVLLAIVISYYLYEDFYITLYCFTFAKIVIYLFAIVITYYFINKYEPVVEFSSDLKESD
jgi:lipopolysaccharide exporter